MILYSVLVKLQMFSCYLMNWFVAILSSHCFLLAGVVLMGWLQLLLAALVPVSPASSDSLLAVSPLVLPAQAGLVGTVAWSRKS